MTFTQRLYRFRCWLRGHHVYGAAGINMFRGHIAGNCYDCGPVGEVGAHPFDKGRLRALADRHDLALKIPTAPEFNLSNDDMKAIAFSLRFTAERL